MKSKVLISSAVLCLVCMLLFPSSVSGSEKLDAATLKVPPADCAAVNGTYPVDGQVGILYERFDIYQQLLPPLVAKKAQSFQCGNQKGTLYYFEFANVASREEAEKLIRPLLWGTDWPTKQHPEQMEHGDALSVVVSFPKPPDALMTALRAELSHAGSATGNSLEAAGVHPLIGDWRGPSISLVKPSACHDEEALYHVRAAATGQLSLQADKIVG